MGVSGRPRSVSSSPAQGSFGGMSRGHRFLPAGGPRVSPVASRVSSPPPAFPGSRLGGERPASLPEGQWLRRADLGARPALHAVNPQRERVRKRGRRTHTRSPRSRARPGGAPTNPTRTPRAGYPSPACATAPKASRTRSRKKPAYAGLSPRQRRGRDLNPRRTFRHIRDFQSRSLDRSDTSPERQQASRSRLSRGCGRRDPPA
jgi:hypothetical protein